MKQPHEDVLGTPREDYLLSLDEQAVPHREALIAMARHLKTACLVGNQAPVVRSIYERIFNPQPGDLVVEMSVMSGRKKDATTRMQGLGVLLEHRKEWWETDEEWERYKAEHDEPDDLERMVEHAWYIQYGSDPTAVCRWVNCSFIVLPIDVQTFHQPVGQPTPTGGIEFTRDTVIRGLSDSGFGGIF